MAKKYRIVMIACCAALLCNFYAKINYIEKQSQQIVLLQKVVAAARSGSYLNSKSNDIKESLDEKAVREIYARIPEEYMFTEYAARIRELIDRNRLRIENNLVFRPEKKDEKDLRTYSTQIKVKGDYSKLKGLIADLLNLNGVVYISEPHMTRMKETPETIRMDLKLFILFKKTIGGEDA